MLGIFATNFTNGPLGCPKSFGTAYAYGAGNQSAANSYNISPGSPNSAWKVAVAQADCNVENPGAGSGPAGFGVLETDEGTSTTVYHRFNAATMKFDAPLVRVAKQSELDAALSQDGAGGIYGTYLLDGAGGPINLSYSAAAWQNNGSVFAQSFQAADAISPASIGGGATDDGTTITVTVTCSSLPCTITITITSSTVIVQKASASLKKAKAVILARGRFRITKGGARKLAVKLTPAGKKFLAAKKGHVKVGSVVAETVARHTQVTRRNLTLTVKRKKGKK